MKNLKHFILLLMAALVMTACGGSDDDGDDSPIVNPTQTNVNRNNTSKNEVYGRLEFPHLNAGSSNVVIIHTVPEFGVNYCVEWDTDLKPTGWSPEGSLRSQRWSCFQLHAGNSSSRTDRKPYSEGGEFSEYPNDPDLDSKYHFTSDPYRYSGYDHGHIMASADRSYSYNNKANTQTFYMTNMQPQVNSFNAKVWANMEAKVRSWNTNNFRDTLYVVKGGTIDRWDQIITTIGSGQNKIPVPKYFFMAVLCKKSSTNTTAAGGYRALGFWIQHKSNSDTDLRPYVVNIDELEEKTGIDFFCNLPDQYEKVVESLPVEQVLRAWNME
ncbi:MAG: DNA/RNA non-specific endonuclease [Prevotella sp.]|nr:DNA/RNA non-specific endonuclease [Prevotella sp.]